MRTVSRAEANILAGMSFDGNTTVLGGGSFNLRARSTLSLYVGASFVLSRNVLEI